MAESLKEVARRVRTEGDIVSVVSRYVTLKKAGNSYKGLCPFHDDKNPSMNVVPSKGIFHCFACGAGGSIIDFLMKIEHLEFMDALRKLAADMGIEIPDERGPEDRAARDQAEAQRRSLLALNEFALEWFAKNLAQKRNALANDMLERRDIPPEMVERFRLGAALDSWDGLVRAARGNGYSEDLLLEAGLAKRSERTGGVYDAFRHRLIFPILDHMDRPIGFGGRRLDDSDEMAAKYINSPETPLYKKGRTLYALNVAQKAIGREGYAILTEGYMDTLMAHRFGFEQAVASLGTGLTPDQARLIKRYAGRVYFLYDSDQAGLNAMLREGEPLLAQGLDTRIITLPDGDDPDDFLKREGPDAMRTRMKESREYFDFALDRHSQDIDLSSLAGQTVLVERLKPLLLAMQNEVLREGAISRLLARMGGLPREAISQILYKRPRAGTTLPLPRHTVSTSAIGGPKPPIPEIHKPAFDPLERFLLKLMLESREALLIIRRGLSEAWLTDKNLEPWILELLYADEESRALVDRLQLEEELPAPMALITAILAEDLPLGTPSHSAEQVLARLKKRHFKRITAQLIRQLQEFEHVAKEEFPEKTLRMIYAESLLAARTEIPRAPIDVM